MNESKTKKVTYQLSKQIIAWETTTITVDKLPNETIEDCDKKAINKFKNIDFSDYETNLDYITETNIYEICRNDPNYQFKIVEKHER